MKYITLLIIILCGYLLSSCVSGRSMRDTANRFNNDITCSNIVSAAQPWLGTPYKYGGTDFDGVDCSGFVQQIFLQVFDVVLPRTTREMFEQGVFVRGGRFSCGDLLFFRNIGGRGGVNHVGIYIGNNRFIHASTTQGVVISDLAENYYAENFVSARRY